MPSYLDLAVLAIVLLSALLALLRGFTREVLGIATWAIAAAFAYYGEFKNGFLLEFAKRYISNDKFAFWAAIVGAFLIALIIAEIATLWLSDLILDSKIGALDRTLGFIFGAARGFLIAVVAFVFYSWWYNDPAMQPVWVREAHMKPILQAAADSLHDAIPQEVPQAIETAISNIKHKKGAPANDEPPAEPESGKMGENPPAAAEKKM